MYNYRNVRSYYQRLPCCRISKYSFTLRRRLTTYNVYWPISGTFCVIYVSCEILRVYFLDNNSIKAGLMGQFFALSEYWRICSAGEIGRSPIILLIPSIFQSVFPLSQNATPATYFWQVWRYNWLSAYMLPSGHPYPSLSHKPQKILCLRFPFSSTQYTKLIFRPFLMTIVRVWSH